MRTLLLAWPGGLYATAHPHAPGRQNRQIIAFVQTLTSAVETPPSRRHACVCDGETSLNTALQPAHSLTPFPSSSSTTSSATTSSSSPSSTSSSALAPCDARLDGSLSSCPCSSSRFATGRPLLRSHRLFPNPSGPARAAGLSGRSPFAAAPPPNSCRYYGDAPGSGGDPSQPKPKPERKPESKSEPEPEPKPTNTNMDIQTKTNASANADTHAVDSKGKEVGMHPSSPSQPASGTTGGASPVVPSPTRASKVPQASGTNTNTDTNTRTSTDTNTNTNTNTNTDTNTKTKTSTDTNTRRAAHELPTVSPRDLLPSLAEMRGPPTKGLDVPPAGGTPFHTKSGALSSAGFRADHNFWAPTVGGDPLDSRLKHKDRSEAEDLWRPNPSDWRHTRFFAFNVEEVPTQDGSASGGTLGTGAGSENAAGAGARAGAVRRRVPVGHGGAEHLRHDGAEHFRHDAPSGGSARPGNASISAHDGEDHAVRTRHWQAVPTNSSAGHREGIHQSSTEEPKQPRWRHDEGWRPDAKPVPTRRVVVPLTQTAVHQSPRTYSPGFPLPPPRFQGAGDTDVSTYPFSGHFIADGAKPVEVAMPRGRFPVGPAGSGETSTNLEPSDMRVKSSNDAAPEWRASSPKQAPRKVIIQIPRPSLANKQAHVMSPFLRIDEKMLKEWGPVLVAHGGNLCFLFAYTAQDMLTLRTLVITGGTCMLIFNWTRPHRLWLPIAWGALFVAVNLAQILFLLNERRPVEFTEEEMSLYEQCFQPHDITPRQFQRFLGAGARWEDVEAGTVLTEQGDPLHSFILLVHGEAYVNVDGHRVFVLQPGSFLSDLSSILPKSQAKAAAARVKPRPEVRPDESEEVLPKVMTNLLRVSQEGNFGHKEPSLTRDSVEEVNDDRVPVSRPRKQKPADATGRKAPALLPRKSEVDVPGDDDASDSKAAKASGNAADEPDSKVAEGSNGRSSTSHTEHPSKTVPSHSSPSGASSPSSSPSSSSSSPSPSPSPSSSSASPSTSSSSSSAPAPPASATPTSPPPSSSSSASSRGSSLGPDSHGGAPVNQEASHGVTKSNNGSGLPASTQASDESGAPSAPRSTPQDPLGNGTAATGAATAIGSDGGQAGSSKTVDTEDFSKVAINQLRGFWESLESVLGRTASSVDRPFSAPEPMSCVPGAIGLRHACVTPPKSTPSGPHVVTEEHLADATIVASLPCRVVSWPVENLRKLLKEDKTLALPAARLITTDLGVKLSAAGAEAVRTMNYWDSLSTVLARGRVSQSEHRVLEHFRQVHHISDQDHLDALERAGWTLEEYNAGVRSRHTLWGALSRAKRAFSKLLPERAPTDSADDEDENGDDENGDMDDEPMDHS